MKFLRRLRRMSQLNRKTVLGFGIGDLGCNLYFSLMGFLFINYMTDRMGLSGTLAGTAMLYGNLWDAITDPIISSLSDRTRSRFGRRHPYMFIGSLLVALFLYLFFSLPTNLPEKETFIKVTVILCLLNTAYTMVIIPYSSLQPELTDDYTDKTRLSGWRMAFALVGTFIAVTGLPIATNSSWITMALIMGSIIVITTFITVFTVKEPGLGLYKKQKGVIRTYREAFTNKEFIPALLAWTLFIMGVTIIQQGYLYYFKYNIGNETLFSIALFGLLIMALITLPLWVKISHKISKAQCYIYGMGLFVIILLAIYFLSPIINGLFTVTLLILGGIGLSTHYIIPTALVPDIVELDAVRSGIRREGAYYSIWNFIMKLGKGIAALIIGITLDISGFVPAVDGVVGQQSSATQDGIALLCGPITAIIIILGMISLKWYPINREYYQKNMEKYKATN